jgi:hypothetical protein
MAACGRVLLLAAIKIALILWLLTGCKLSFGKGGQILEAFNPVSLLPFPTFIQVRQLGICDFSLFQALFSRICMYLSYQPQGALMPSLGLRSFLVLTTSRDEANRDIKPSWALSFKLVPMSLRLPTLFLKPCQPAKERYNQIVVVAVSKEAKNIVTSSSIFLSPQKQS